MSEIKMSDVFGEKLPCRPLGEIIIFEEISNLEGDDVIETFIDVSDLTPKEREAIVHAVNNHDQLKLRIKELKDALRKCAAKCYKVNCYCGCDDCDTKRKIASQDLNKSEKGGK